jgi:hypothetical protein
MTLGKIYHRAPHIQRRLFLHKNSKVYSSVLYLWWWTKPPRNTDAMLQKAMCVEKLSRVSHVTFTCMYHAWLPMGPFFLRMAIWLNGLERWYLVLGGVAVGRGFEPQSALEHFFAGILIDIRTCRITHASFPRMTSLTMGGEVAQWDHLGNEKNVLRKMPKFN